MTHMTHHDALSMESLMCARARYPSMGICVMVRHASWSKNFFLDASGETFNLESVGYVVRGSDEKISIVSMCLALSILWGNAKGSIIVACTSQRRLQPIGCTARIA